MAAGPATGHLWRALCSGPSSLLNPSRLPQQTFHFHLLISRQLSPVAVHPPFKPTTSCMCLITSAMFAFSRCLICSILTIVQ